MFARGLKVPYLLDTPFLIIIILVTYYLTLLSIYHYLYIDKMYIPFTIASLLSLYIICTLVYNLRS